jgi:uncharacterized protein YbcV (DUF1398 family)
MQDLKWTYEGTTDPEAYPPERHMFAKQFTGRSADVDYQTFYRWIEREIGVEGTGWSMHGNNHLLIKSDEHALSFRMRWC